MAQFNFKQTSQAALLVSIAAAFPVLVHGAPAARVDFASGNVTAVSPSGQARPLSKGAQLEQGETIATNTGRAQLRFTDGAYVSLQPQSEFRIDQYRFEGKQDGNEKGVFSLLKGGLRTITGLVGRSNKKNYQINTAVATIGIRGTEYTIQYGQSITGTVGEGEIEVCNGAGCLNVTNGESYYVQNQDVKPELSNKGTDLPPTPPESPPQKFAENENVDQSGELCTLFPERCQIQPTGILTGTQTLDTVKGNFCDGPCFGPNSGVTVVFDSAGKLVSYGSIVPTSVQMSGNDGIVAWGTFTDTSSFGALTHFVAGIPVPSADLTNLGGTTGSYSLIGSTPVTDSLDKVIGTLNGATLTVSFGASVSASAGMNWTINGSPLSASLTGSGSGSNFFLSGSCGASCSVSSSVALFGPNAIRAGMVYSISDFLINLSALGAAVFAKN